MERGRPPDGGGRNGLTGRSGDESMSSSRPDDARWDEGLSLDKSVFRGGVVVLEPAAAGQSPCVHLPRYLCTMLGNLVGCAMKRRNKLRSISPSFDVAMFLSC